MTTSPRYSKGPRAIATLVGHLTKPVFGNRGLSEGRLLTDWHSVVGNNLAAYTLPERLVFSGDRRDQGTLHLRVDGASLALEIAHLEPQLIARINGHFGYRAVARLKIRQAPLPPAKPSGRAPRRALDSDEEHRIERQLHAIDDPELRAVLDDLGRVILSNSED